MKKAVILAVMLLVSVPAFAHSPLYAIPSEAYSDNDTQRQPWGYGLGVDTVVYRGNSPLLDEVRVDTRYDIENRETRVFGVVKIDLFSYLSKGS